MRLIDADALLNRMRKDPLFDLVEIHGVSGVIEAEPTVDAVPVIRCKDCKYYSGKWCKRHSISDFDLNDVMTMAYDFCSRAERKEE